MSSTAHQSDRHPASPLRTGTRTAEGSHGLRCVTQQPQHVNKKIFKWEFAPATTSEQRPRHLSDRIKKTFFFYSENSFISCFHVCVRVCNARLIRRKWNRATYAIFSIQQQAGRVWGEGPSRHDNRGGNESVRIAHDDRMAHKFSPRLAYFRSAFIYIATTYEQQDEREKCNKLNIHTENTDIVARVCVWKFMCLAFQYLRAMWNWVFSNTHGGWHFWVPPNGLRAYALRMSIMSPLTGYMGETSYGSMCENIYVYNFGETICVQNWWRRWLHVQ